MRIAYTRQQHKLQGIFELIFFHFLFWGGSDDDDCAARENIEGGIVDMLEIISLPSIDLHYIIHSPATLALCGGLLLFYVCVCCVCTVRLGTLMCLASIHSISLAHAIASHAHTHTLCSFR